MSLPPKMRARSPVSDMLFAATLALAGTSCAAGAGPVVTAPSVAGTPATPGTDSAGRAPGGPAACSQSWALEDAVGGSARVILICGSDLQRVPIAEGPMTRALDPPLDLARQKVCECAAS